jgi:hypothetical protein
MGPAVVLGQDLADLAWAVCDSAVADLAARDRQLGDSVSRPGFVGGYDALASGMIIV